VQDIQYIIAGEDGFKNKTLDDLLAKGFYRMQHLMFTCNKTVINYETHPIPVFWLRTIVQKVKPGKNALNIIKKCAGFKVIITDAYVDEEIETLYAHYKKHVSFIVSENCKDYLHLETFVMPFNSKMIKVYNNKKLIAAGYFDKGKNAIAGIMNIYHPEYKTYSLGKFLMLQKLQFALSENTQFYYTGYISTESVRFDYKTFPDANAVEVLLPLQEKWVPYNLFGKKFLAEYYSKFLLADESDF